MDSAARHIYYIEYYKEVIDLPGSGIVQVSHLKCSLGSEGWPMPTMFVAAILNS